MHGVGVAMDVGWQDRRARIRKKPNEEKFCLGFLAYP